MIITLYYGLLVNTSSFKNFLVWGGHLWALQRKGNYSGLKPYQFHAIRQQKPSVKKIYVTY